MTIKVAGLCAEAEFDFNLLLGLEIKLPGGVSIKPKLDFGSLPDTTIVVGSLLRELNPALTPLVPIFRVIDLAMSLVNFAKAVPDSLGPPPDPTKISSALEAVVEKAGFLAQLLPPLSVPVLMKGILGAVIGGLDALKVTLASLVKVGAGINTAANLRDLLLNGDGTPGSANVAAGLAMQASVDCSQANFELQLQATAVAMAPIASLLSLLKLFASIAGLPVNIPDLTLDLSGSVSIGASLPVIDDFIKLLQTVHDALPG